MELNNMNCKKCDNPVLENTKFCGKCGAEISVRQQDIPTENQNDNDTTQNKLIDEIKQVGGVFYGFGYLVIGLVIILFFVGQADSGLPTLFSYSDLAIGVVGGILWIILGGRVRKNVDIRTKRYLWIIFWLLLINIVISFVVQTAKGNVRYTGIVIPILLAIYANKGLKKLKKIDIPAPTVQYKLHGWRWLWFVILSVIFVAAGLFFDISGDLKFEEFSIDKSTLHSETTGNTYRNTKYGFRIQFPEGWEIKPGDRPHILQKATFDGHSIMVIVQHFYFQNIRFSSIKDAGSPKEFIDEILEGTSQQFSDVRLIDYGETKINNEPTYWVEYSTKIDDLSLQMTQLSYFFAKGKTTYSINAGTGSAEYPQIKPKFLQTISTFTLEN